MPADHLELWLVDLDACAPALAAIEEAVPRLSAAERERARIQPQPREATRRLAAYTALRILIERAGGAGLRGRPFTRGSKGKPELAGTGIAFSLSHTQELALIGVARGQPVGVDLEKSRPLVVDRRHVERVCAAGAGLCREPLPQRDEDRAFLQAWVRLEAFSKARGTSLAGTLVELGVRGQAERRRAPDRIEARTQSAVRRAGLVVRDLELPRGLYGAVAIARAPRTVPVLQLPAARADIERLATAEASVIPADG